MGIFGIIYAVAFVAMVLLFLIALSTGSDDFSEFSLSELTFFGKIMYVFLAILSLPITGPVLIIVLIGAFLGYVLKFFVSLCVK
jgi:hypothetical protein